MQKKKPRTENSKNNLKVQDSKRLKNTGQNKTWVNFPSFSESLHNS